jgi:hypothetical protein
MKMVYGVVGPGVLCAGFIVAQWFLVREGQRYSPSQHCQNCREVTGPYLKPLIQFPRTTYLIPRGSEQILL